MRVGDARRPVKTARFRYQLARNWRAPLNLRKRRLDSTPVAIWNRQWKILITERDGRITENFWDQGEGLGPVPKMEFGELPSGPAIIVEIVSRPDATRPGVIRAERRRV
jgi:hypothetical protein